MIVKDLISKHLRVAESRENIKVMIGIYNDHQENVEMYLPDNAIQEYGNYLVKNWFQTSETTSDGILIEIDILIGG